MGPADALLQAKGKGIAWASMSERAGSPEADRGIQVSRSSTGLIAEQLIQPGRAKQDVFESFSHVF